jgi:hypothetical protein
MYVDNAQDFKKIQVLSSMFSGQNRNKLKKQTRKILQKKSPSIWKLNKACSNNPWSKK